MVLSLARPTVGEGSRMKSAREIKMKSKVKSQD